MMGKGTLDMDFIIAVIFFVAVYANLYIALPTLISTFRVNNDAMWTEAVFLSDMLIYNAGLPKNWSEGGGGYAKNISFITPNPCTIFWSNGSRTSCVNYLLVPDGFYYGMTNIDNSTLKFQITGGQPGSTYMSLRACNPAGLSLAGVYVVSGGSLTLAGTHIYAPCGGVPPVNWEDYVFNLSSYLPDSNNEYNVTINGTTLYYDYAHINTTTASTVQKVGFAYFNSTAIPCILDRSKVVSMLNQSCNSMKFSVDVLLDFKVSVETYKENITCTTSLPKYTKLVERVCYLREDAGTYTPAKFKLWVW